MARYVGKVLSVPNNGLGLRRSGTHYVHVRWYNPFKKSFWCRIMTSLEQKKTSKELTTTTRKSALSENAETFITFLKSKNVSVCVTARLRQYLSTKSRDLMYGPAMKIRSI